MHNVVASHFFGMLYVTASNTLFLCSAAAGLGGFLERSKIIG